MDQILNNLNKTYKGKVWDYELVYGNCENLIFRSIKTFTKPMILFHILRYKYKNS